MEFVMMLGRHDAVLTQKLVKKMSVMNPADLPGGFAANQSAKV
jgi:hypothetical protein